MDHTREYATVASESAKRDLDATAWAVALAAPGLFAGLSQVSNLFVASRVPGMFGYVFGAMVLMLLVSIVFGLRNHNRLQGLIRVQTMIGANRVLDDAFRSKLADLQQSTHRDQYKIDQVRKDIDDNLESLERQLKKYSEILSDDWGIKMSIHQQLLLQYAYILFILIVVSSDFSKLLKPDLMR